MDLLKQLQSPGADQIHSYQRDGFVRIADALPADLIASYRDVCTQLVRTADAEHRRQQFQRDYAPEERATIIRLLKQSGAGDSAQTSATYARAFTQIANLWRYSEPVRELVFSPRLAQMAAALLQTEGVRIYHDQALFKEAGGGHTPWHVDQFYWPLSTEKTLTLWIPLQPVTADMGPLVFAAGSQQISRDSIAGKLAISDESETVLAALMKDYPQIEAPFNAGEVSFHSGWTCHRAGPNLTDTTRAAFTIIYVAADARMIEPRHHNHAMDAALWLPGVRPGQPAASALNPLVYLQ